MPQILDIYPGTIVNLVFCLYDGVLQEATRLGLLTIDYLLTRCLSRRGWDQNTAYHQLTKWANGTNQLRASLDQNETRAMFLSSLLWGALLWPIKNNPICGRTARQQKTKASTKNCWIGHDPLPRQISNISWLGAAAPRHQKYHCFCLPLQLL